MEMINAAAAAAAGDEEATLLFWRDDAAQWLQSCRADVVAQWHQLGTREAAVEDIASYLLESWYFCGETTRSLLGDTQEEEEEEVEDATTGQLLLAQLVAQAVVDSVLADVPHRSYFLGPEGAAAILDAERDDAKNTKALAWIDAANAVLAAQRTAAWHYARSQLFSASSLHKLLSTPAQYNSIVYEKCTAMRARQQRALHDNSVVVVVVLAAADEPEDTGPRKLRYKPPPAGATPMHRLDNDAVDDESRWSAPVFRHVLDARNWGTKYEPLSTDFYRHRNGGAEGNAPELRTDLGCLRHRTHAFIGASPDGVVFGPPGHPKRGFNVEIKNIVDRPITGDPKPEYYVQFQIQMEVCDLQHTDFLETRFREYEFADDYFTRQTLRPDLPHGIVLHFTPKMHKWGFDDDDDKEEKEKAARCKAEWVFSAPGQALRAPEEVDVWIHFHKASRLDMEMDDAGYWCLETYSCVCSDRNREWFEAVLPTIADAWQTVERESAEGTFEHRAPGGVEARRKRAVAAAAFWDDEEDDQETSEVTEEAVVVVLPPCQEETKKNKNKKRTAKKEATCSSCSASSSRRTKRPKMLDKNDPDLFLLF